MVDLAEEVGDIELDHELIALDEPAAQPLFGHRRRPLRPKPIRTRHKVRLENRFQHDLGRLLGHPVPHRGDGCFILLLLQSRVGMFGSVVELC
jgi:hypothetical protein